MIRVFFALLLVGCGSVNNEYRFDHTFVNKYQHYFESIDLTDVIIYDNASVLFTFTVGNTIKLSAGTVYDLNNEKFVQLMFHELAHVEQYEMMGFTGFMRDYIEDSWDNNLIHDDLFMEKQAEQLSRDIMDLEFGHHYIPKGSKS